MYAFRFTSYNAPIPFRRAGVPPISERRPQNPCQDLKCSLLRAVLLMKAIVNPTATRTVANVSIIQ